MLSKIYATATQGEYYELDFFILDLGKEKVDSIIIKNAEAPILAGRSVVSSTTVPNIILFAGNNVGHAIYGTETSFKEDVTKDDCVMHTRNHGKCLRCRDSTFLQQNNRCFGYCSPGTLRFDGYCLPCSRFCVECEGDVNTCSSCSEGKMNVGRSCVEDESCAAGYLAKADGVCVRKCPKGTVMTSSETGRKTPAEAETLGRYFTHFAGPSSGIKVATPEDITEVNFPEKWTVMMWVKSNEWTDPAHLLNAFNFIKVSRTHSEGYGYSSGSVAVKIGEKQFAPTAYSLTAVNVLDDDTWTFIAVSKGIYFSEKMQRHLLLNIFVSANVESGSAQSLEFSIALKNTDKDVRPTALEKYIVLGADGNSEENSFVGYMMHFRMIGRYFDTSELRTQMTHYHGTGLSDMLAYWRLNPSSTSELEEDRSLYQVPLGSSIASVHSNIKLYDNIGDGAPDGDGNPVYFCDVKLYSWVDEYSCRSPFDGELPLFAIAGAVYDDLTTLNHVTNIVDELSFPFADGDALFATEENCTAGIHSYAARKNVALASDKVTLVVEKPFSSLLSGHHYRMCYFSASSYATHLLSWIYIARVPEGATPSKSVVYAQWDQAFDVQVHGGDNSFDSILYVAKSDEHVMRTDDDALRTESAMRNSEGVYTINIYKMSSGLYSLYWRPSYSEAFEHYVQIPGATVQKYLAPPIYLCTFPSTLATDSATGKLKHKAALSTVNLNGNYVNEGDQIAIHKQLTGYSELYAETCEDVDERYVYTYSCGAFPQIYFGDSYFAGSDVTDKFTLCYKPRNKDALTDGFFAVVEYEILPAPASIPENNDTGSPEHNITEIKEFYPPLESPFVGRSDKVGFQLAESSLNILDTSGMTINIVFPFQQLVYPTNDNKLEQLEGEEGKFVLPVSNFELGYHYEVKMPANANVSNSGELAYLFNSNPLEFKFRVVDFEIESARLVQEGSAWTITVQGKNFERFIPSIRVDGHLLEYVTVSHKADLYLVNSERGTTETLLSSANAILNNTHLQFSNVDIQDKAGELVLTLELFRECACNSLTSIDKAYDPTFFYGGGRLKDLVIGSVGCKSSCYRPKGLAGSSCTEYLAAYEKRYLCEDRCVDNCVNECSGAGGMDKWCYHNVTGEEGMRTECINECGENEYLIEPYVCGICDSSCEECEGSGVGKCTKCSDGKSYIQGRCVDDLPDQIPLEEACKDWLSVTAEGIYKAKTSTISLTASVKNNISPSSIQWYQIVSGQTSTSLFTSSSVSTSKAIVNYSQLDQFPIGSKILVAAEAQVIAGSSPCNTVGLINLNHTLNLRQANASISPKEGSVHEVEFTLVMENWTLLESAKVEVSTSMGLVYNRVFLRNYYEENIVLGPIPFTDWRSSHDGEAKEFEVKIKVSLHDESLIYYDKVTLTSEYKLPGLEKALSEVNTSSITHSNVALISKLLASFYTLKDSHECNTEADCNDKGVCEQGKCKCSEGYEGIGCESDVVSGVNMSELLEEVKEYLADSAEDKSKLSVEQYTGVVINVAKISELLGEDTTGNLKSYSGAMAENLGREGADAELVKYFLRAVDIVTREDVAAAEEILRASNESEKRLAAKQLMDAATNTIYSALAVAAANSESGTSSVISTDRFTAEVRKETLGEGEYTKEFAVGGNGTTVSVSSKVLSSLEDATVRVRVVEWKSNPFNYANSAHKVNTDVISFSFIDAKGEEIHLETNEGITLTMPVLRGVDNTFNLKCTHFSFSFLEEANGSFLRTVGVDIPMGDFVLDDGSYEGYDRVQGRITCKYYHLSDFAAMEEDSIKKTVDIGKDDEEVTYVLLEKIV